MEFREETPGKQHRGLNPDTRTPGLSDTDAALLLYVPPAATQTSSFPSRSKARVSRGSRTQDPLALGCVLAAQEERLVLLQPQAPLLSSSAQAWPDFSGSPECPGRALAQRAPTYF